MATSTRNMSLPSIKSQMSQFMENQRNGKRKCGFAPWLTIPQIVIKGLELVLSVIVITLLFVWESEGVKISSLDQDEYNYRNRVYYFVGVACITIMYAIVMTILGVAGVIIPSKALTFFAGVCLSLWLLAAPIMSATLDILEDSVFARKHNLDIFSLKIAVVFGFLLLVAFVSDILLGFLALRRSSTSDTFRSEIKHSRSILAAAKISARNSKRKLSVN